MKERKTQILAALALAFMLGAVVPTTTFALEGEEDAAVQAEEEGIEAQSETKETEAEILPLTDSVVELTARITSRESFANYVKAQKYLYYAGVMSEYTGSIDNYVTNRQTSAEDGDFWSHLNDDEASKIRGKSVWDAMQQLKTDEGSAWKDEAEKMKGWVDLVISAMTNDMKALRVQMSIVLDGESSETAEATGHQKYDTFDTPAKILAEAEKLESYSIYKALYVASDFVITEISQNSLGCSAAGESKLVTLDYCEEKRAGLISAFEKDYDTEGAIVSLLLDYSAYLSAAMKIDNTVSAGLYQLLDAGSGAPSPNIPNSGVLELLGTDGLDLATITLIASVAVASLAGAGLIAKLYLKHKF